MNTFWTYVIILLIGLAGGLVMFGVAALLLFVVGKIFTGLKALYRIMFHKQVEKNWLAEEEHHRAEEDEEALLEAETPAMVAEPVKAVEKPVEAHTAPAVTIHEVPVAAETPGFEPVAVPVVEEPAVEEPVVDEAAVEGREFIKPAPGIVIGSRRNRFPQPAKKEATPEPVKVPEPAVAAAPVVATEPVAVEPVAPEVKAEPAVAPVRPKRPQPRLPRRSKPEADTVDEPRVPVVDPLAELKRQLGG